jgi:PAS domain S-box-containing protein
VTDATSQALYMALIEHSLDLIAALDDQGLITFHSPSVRRILGYEPADLVGRNVFEFIHPDDRDRVKAEFDRACRIPGPTPLLEYRFLHQNETWRVLESVGSAVPGPRGVHIGILNSRDITESRALQDRLHHVQRVATLGRMASTVVHEFHNTLLVMLLNVDQILESKVAPELTPQLTDMKRAAELATALARQVLDLSRPNDSRPQSSDVNAGITSMVPILQRLAGRNIRLGTSLAAQRSTVLARFGWLDQVLVNLVSNARDAILDAGSIAITTRNAGNLLLLEVDDDGVGIPLRMQDRIFEPFFTTKSASNGTGLGLSTVREIVEDAGGRIEVRSAVGCGTTFTLSLPVAEE